MKGLWKRVLVAIVGIPAILGLTYLGGPYFLLFLVVISAVGLWEFYSLFTQKDVYPYRILGIFIGISFLLLVFFENWEILYIFMIISLTGILLLLLSPQKGIASLNAVFTMAGIFYTPFFLSAILKVRLSFDTWFLAPEGANWGGWYLIIVWASIWICDTAAYFGGSYLGKHKLAPNISPKKTVEGAVTGLIFGLITFILLGKWWLPELPATLFWWSGLIVGILGQLGDLVESRFKRDAEVKDSSTILPGHGGFLDRFDSFTYVSPFLFLLLYIFQHGRL